MMKNYMVTKKSRKKETDNMKKRSLIASLLLLIMFCVMFTVPVGAENNSEIKILINDRVVEFTDDTGYPYVDENNRTMVPLRVTMETAGFAVGYDPNAHTAIVITNYNRIEIPIGTNKIYVNNELIENDTIAVAKDGRTYLPIRVVLENAGYTVEWDAATRTVNAYNFKFDENELIPYSTSNPATLINNILNGNVVYINGKYYATPDYVKMLANVQVHYLGDDLNTAIYPQESRHVLSPDSKVIIIEHDDKEEKQEEKALKERIRKLLESGGSVAE